MKNKIIIGIIALLVIVLGVVIYKGSTPTKVGDSSTISQGMNFGGLVYTQGGIQFGGGSSSLTIASSSTTTALTAVNFGTNNVGVVNSNYNLILITTGTTTYTEAINLPASSTFPTSFLPNAGDSDDIYFYAASTTASNLILVSGTGFTIKSPIGVASTTAASSTLQAGGVVVMNILRLPSGNLLGLLMPAI